MSGPGCAKDGLNAPGEGRMVLQGLELGLRKRVVIGDLGLDTLLEATLLDEPLGLAADRAGV